MVAELAEDPISRADLSIKFQEAPHEPPTNQPTGTMAVYGVWGDGGWLKVTSV
jgi:hypothetical protein